MLIPLSSYRTLLYCFRAGCATFDIFTLILLFAASFISEMFRIHSFSYLAIRLTLLFLVCIFLKFFLNFQCECYPNYFYLNCFYFLVGPFQSPIFECDLHCPSCSPLCCFIGTLFFEDKDCNLSRPLRIFQSSQHQVFLPDL